MFRLLFVLLLFQATSLYGQNSLVVFLQGNQGTADGVMSDQDLKMIEALAKKLKVEFVPIDAKAGVPEEISYTPSIMLKSSKGISRYYGRYNNASRLETFIRSADLIPPKEVNSAAKKTLVWPIGRSKVLAETKFTEVSGNLPADFNKERFQTLALQAFENGMTNHSWDENHIASEGDRKFYYALYPYVDRDTLYVSLEMYSQFNCVEPLIKLFETPIAGPLNKYQDVMRAIGGFLTKKTQEAIFQGQSGDHFFPINKAHPSKGWDELGLKSTTNSSNSQKNLALNLKGSFANPVPVNKDRSMLVFRFAAPLDGYKGEVGEIEGALKIPKANKTEGLSGTFEVPISSITMGDPGLDDHIWHDLLKDKFPKAKLELKRMVSGDKEFLWGQQTRATFEGKFEMMGKSIPVEVRTQFEPRLNENNKVVLSALGSFTISIKTFGLEGPEGPSPANETLEFYFDLILNNE